ncbi:hypothetical protein Cni_G25163 [Canna indica]|uniref:VQ domain-containing protein n=1 Tax=Canna indica TaxID=4628 RepID=A0AAQ3L1E5_9LILI|nr:hypothetical protein Cni_G25163 [Canna indica]
MGRPSAGQQKCFRAKKKTTSKSRPIKVVYISNPMRVTTSAANFRGLVQRLTGRDSTVADQLPVADQSSDFVDFDDDTDELSAEDSGAGSGAGAAAAACDFGAAAVAARRGPRADLGAVLLDPCKSEAAEALPFEVYDDVFAAQMMESLPPPGLPQSALCYESLTRWILETQ